MSQEKITTLNAAKSLKMNGQSPRERANEKAKKVLDWVYRWGYVSAKTAELVCNTSRTSIAKRLEKSGFLISTKTEAGGSLANLPSALFTLSALGLELVEKDRETLIEYELDPFKIRQDQLRHNEIAQIITANQLNEKRIVEFLTEKECAQKSEKGKKQPDIVWKTQDNYVFYVEIELSAKWSRKLDQFVEYNVVALCEKKCHKILIYSDSDAIIKRYKEAFAPGREIKIWEKNEKGFYNCKETDVIPDFVKGKVICLKI